MKKPTLISSADIIELLEIYQNHYKKEVEHNKEFKFYETLTTGKVHAFLEINKAFEQLIMATEMTEKTHELKYIPSYKPNIRWLQAAPIDRL